MQRNKTVSIFIIIFCAIVLFILCIFSGISMQGIRASAIEEETCTEQPVITILQHGLGGSPLDWSNNNNFSYSRDYSGQFVSSNFEYRSDTLIERLRQKNENSNVYIVSENKNKFIDEDNEQTLTVSDVAISRYDINEETYVRTPVSDFDFSNHVIIVYDSKYYEGSTLSTEIVYQRFKKVINAVIKSYKDSHSEVCPKMNLIGHSRGTIINLKYATQYPDRIDSMFAMGGLSY